MSRGLENLHLTRRGVFGLLLVPISVSLAACGGGAAGDTSAAGETTTPTVPPTATSEPTATQAPTATSAPTEDATSAATPAPEPTEAASDVVAVQIVDFAFDPPNITIPAGTTVEWTNVGPTPHNVVSQEGIWESPIMEAGATYRFTFEEPGMYSYWCTLHPTMLGSVTVQ